MTPARRSLHDLRQDRRGATAVEFALVLPALLAMLLGVAEAGRAFWMQSALNYAVQEAARCAVIQVAAPAGQRAACGTAADTAAYAVAKVPQLKLPASDFAVDPANACGGALVTAAVPYRPLLLPVFPKTLILTARACHA